VSTSCLDDRVKLWRVSPSQSVPLQAPNERSLVERARSDAAAFAELYRHYLPRVHAYAWRRTGSRESAEDVTAATFEAVLRALPRFRWGPGGFAPWLFRIAANQVIAHHRSEARPRSERGQRAMATMTDTSTDDAFTELTAGPVGIGGGDGDQVRQALARLTPRYQRAIDLRYLVDLDHEAAAKAMGLAKPAFAVVLSRALKALRRELGRIDDGLAGKPSTSKAQASGNGGPR
jgi:RNA polymerase sigma-70 factor (ECF subfamily)